MEIKPVRLMAQLPPTAVSSDMRDKVKAIAEREQVSIGQIVRTALNVFLSQNSNPVRVTTFGSDIEKESARDN